MVHLDPAALALLTINKVVKGRRSGFKKPRSVALLQGVKMRLELSLNLKKDMFSSASN